MSTAKPPAPRKRNGKRKRRLASPSPSSSPSSDSSDSSSDEASRKAPLQRVPLIKKQATPSPSSADESSPSPSLSSSSDSENDDAPHVVGAPSSHVATSPNNARRFSDPEPPAATGRRPPPSPSPPPAADAPPFLLPEGSSDRGQEEQALRNRSRQFWMASIRQESNMTKSRLALLIDSLASGGEVFSSHADKDGDLNEMDVVLNGNHRDT
ncbi:hypothetical protein F5148DRAFT_1190343 [Russula earlei]|uniref:Uncharacterized protein n=2 Tax=Russula earlei TaxID=71964 RepID=A0ACC0UDE7_9AGAM|nr:hypothetical protein F5148DRAFT_1190343 [Russula earlei]